MDQGLLAETRDHGSSLNSIALFTEVPKCRTAIPLPISFPFRVYWACAAWTNHKPRTHPGGSVGEETPESEPSGTETGVCPYLGFHFCLNDVFPEGSLRGERVGKTDTGGNLLGLCQKLRCNYNFSSLYRRGSTHL